MFQPPEVEAVTLGHETWNTLIILTGGLASLAIFSILIRENGFYRFFEHLFIGISAGIGLIVAIKNFFWPRVFVPLLGLNIVRYPDGTYSSQYNSLLLLYIVPMLFGLLYYFIYSKNYSWLAKLVIGFSLGLGGGAAFQGFFNGIMPQLVGSFKPLLIFSTGGSLQIGASLSNVLFVFTLLAVMYYFFFSLHSGSKVLQRFSLCGRWLMMVSFGAFFGSTIMARMALLVERLQFLINEWIPALFIAAGRLTGIAG